GPLLACRDRLLNRGAAWLPGLPPVPAIAGPRVSTLLAAWAADDAPGVEAAAATLAGLGPGLTPSGDDLLAGLCVAMARVWPGDWRPLAAAIARGSLEQTTTIGAARIRYATEGELDERSECALAALLGGPDQALERAVRELLAFGHSSGLDTLVGLVLGLDLALSRWTDE
ncbi:MAG: DUF2877 domain-containing protein, partial [Chloroflexi bacterium]|nr:DUF2877 domain-containing protein [Chloroflexota bacterium]